MLLACVSPCRQGHACAVVGIKAYIFGGSAVAQDGSPFFHNDLYSINRKMFCNEMEIGACVNASVTYIGQLCPPLSQLYAVNAILLVRRISL